MVKEYMKSVVLVCVLALILVSAAAMAQTPAESVADMVANSGIFPAGTSIVGLTCDGTSLVVDLSVEAIPFPFTDTQSDSYSEAINDAVEAWVEITDIAITVAGQPLWTYLPPSSGAEMSSGGSGGDVGITSVDGGFRTLAAQNPLLPPSVAPGSGELAGKLVVLHPSHGTYASTTSWFRAMRTFCGPNPVTNRPPGISTYQPSDYYYWTKGFRFPSYYEDDMSPETIRFLYAYCQSAGAATFCSRNLDKTAGNFDAVGYGYPAAPFTNKKWMTAAKYALQDRGGVPATVWNTTDVTGQSNIDIRARPYYANWLMTTLGYDKTNSVSFSLHTNAASVGQARGTETYWYVFRTADGYPSNDPYGVRTLAIAYATAVEAGVINAIRNQYDGNWGGDMYPKVTPNPPEFPSASGTYRGYVQDGDSVSRWQDRGVKTSDFGEIRNARMPAQLMELLFHDDWKFYPDMVFHEDRIFRATVGWGMYEGICNYFGVAPKPRLAASVDSVSFPGFVLPNTAVSGTVSMKNLGQAWCWGDKWVAMVYAPYTVWALAATADDQFGAAGTKIAIANDGNYYPGDSAAFSVSLTSPAASGYYTTSWQMLKDDAKGGSFGATASATIGVDGIAPEITISAPEDKWYNGDPITVTFSATDNMSGVDTIVANVDGTDVASGDAVSGLGSGLHTLAVSATDTVGNEATKSQSFNVDTGAPVVTIVTPQATGYLHTGSIAISFSAADPYSGVASTTATMDGVDIANGASYSLLWNALGAHTLAVTSTDNVGNSGTTTVTFTIGATLESMSAAINELYGLGQIDNEGIQNSLLVKLAKYEKDVGSIADAKNYLRNFINEVSAQSGKHLTVAAANLLLADANYVIAHLPAE